MEIKTLGIDIGKRTFHLIGMDKKGNITLRKKLSRPQLLPFVATLTPCLIGIESCSGAHYWGRQFSAHGHEVKLISPQFVKPYVKGNKNDFNDSEAICEAVSRPTMRFVRIKSIEQQNIQNIHSIRQRLVGNRTALANQIRGILTEYGIVIPQGILHIGKQISEIINREAAEVSSLIKTLLQDLYEEFHKLDLKIKQMDRCIQQISRKSDVCQRLEKLKGIGPITSTALIGAIGDAKEFKNGRHLSAWLGLVPKQHSTGGKAKLLGISKRGNCYLRTLLIHGARSAIRYVGNEPSWLKNLIDRRGKHKACIAFANKNARLIWAIMSKGENYQYTL